MMTIPTTTTWPCWSWTGLPLHCWLNMPDLPACLRPPISWSQTFFAGSPAGGLSARGVRSERGVWGMWREDRGLDVGCGSKQNHLKFSNFSFKKKTFYLLKQRLLPIIKICMFTNCKKFHQKSKFSLKTNLKSSLSSLYLLACFKLVI